MLKKTIIALFSLALVAVMTGCANTMEGVGADIEKMGKSIKEAVSSDKDKDSK